MPAKVEGQVLLELGHVGVIAGVARLGELCESGIRSSDVDRVVLVVMQLHNPRADVRLKGCIVVRKIRKCVLSHQILLANCPRARERYRAGGDYFSLLKATRRAHGSFPAPEVYSSMSGGRFASVPGMPRSDARLSAMA